MYTADMTHNISTPLSTLGIQFIQALKHIFNFVCVIPVGLLFAYLSTLVNQGHYYS